MALFRPGMPCRFCGKPMQEEEDLIGFTMVRPDRDDFLRPINDSVVHTDCLSRHPQRDQIVTAWNAATETGLTVDFMLEVTPSGRVQYLGWWSRWKARWQRWRRRTIS